jgi:hypothetical protein
MVKRLACMVMCGVVPSDSLDILQPALLHKEMLPQVRINYAVQQLFVIIANFVNFFSENF